MFLTFEDVRKLPPNSFYIVLNGRAVHTEPNSNLFEPHDLVDVRIRIRGGKGGFGSLLKAFGKGTKRQQNTDACRDLSGRRLGDVKQEEKLKKWISKAKERERERVAKRKSRLEKLANIGEGKHTFEDNEYIEQRERLLEKSADAVADGLKNVFTPAAAAASTSASISVPTSELPSTSGAVPASSGGKPNSTKRATSSKLSGPSCKRAMFLGIDISSDEDD